MTRKEACKWLGIHQNAGHKRAEQAYRKMHTELRHKLCCGNTKQDRLKAQADMASLMTARDIICRKSPIPKPSSQKQKRRKAAKPKPYKATASTTVNNPSKPTTLADAWGLFADLMPFSELIIAIVVLIVIFLIGLRYCFFPMMIIPLVVWILSRRFLKP